MKILVKFSNNWADEMDIEGLYVTTQEEHNEFIKKVHNYFKSNNELIYTVGSNEEIEFSNAEELLECYTVVCSDIHACGLGPLEFADFLSIGFCGPDDYCFDSDEYDDDDDD